MNLIEILSDFRAESLFDASNKLLKHLGVKCSTQTEEPIPFLELYEDAAKDALRDALVDVKKSVGKGVVKSVGKILISLRSIRTSRANVWQRRLDFRCGVWRRILRS